MMKLILLLLFILFTYQDVTQKQLKDISNCICVAFKNENIEINNNLREKCVLATDDDGKLIPSVYNNFPHQYKTAFAAVDSLLPYDCLNITFREQTAKYEKQRRTIYQSTISQQTPLLIQEVYSTREVSVTLKTINVFIRNTNNIRFKLSIGTGLHNYYGIESNPYSWFLKGTNWFSVQINNDDLTANLSPGVNTLSFYKLLNQNTIKFNNVVIRRPYVGIMTIGVAGMGALQFGANGYMSQAGPGMDNVKEYTLVVPSGDVLTVNENKNKKLFRALKGTNGGNFGFIAEYKVKVYPDPGMTFYGYLWVGTPELYADVINVFQNISLNYTRPDFVNIVLAYKSFTIAPGFSTFAPLFTAICNNTKEICDPIINEMISKFPTPIPALLPPYTEYYPIWEGILSGCLPSSVTQLPNGKYVCTDPYAPEYPKNQLFFETPAWFYKGRLSYQQILNITKLFATLPSDSITQFSIFSSSKVVRSVPNTKTAFGFREFDFVIQITTGTPDPAEYENNKRFTKQIYDYLKPTIQKEGFNNGLPFIFNGATFNMSYYTGGPYTKRDYTTSYNGLVNLERLIKLKTEVDPLDLFSTPYSIPVDD